VCSPAEVEFVEQMLASLALLANPPANVVWNADLVHGVLHRIGHM
jgi:hypothetical protein